MREYLTGKRIGKLIVIEELDERKNGCIMWKCRCDCGNEIVVETRKLTSGRVTSCGCQKKKLSRNIAGEKFGKLTALEPTANRTRNGYVIWKCRCDCGNELEVSRNILVQGMKHSCGCGKRTSVMIGKVFGDLRVEEINEHSASYITARVRCVCGREFSLRRNDLVSGRITNCGCRGDINVQEVDYQRLEYPIQGKVPKKSKSGYRGVSYNARRNKWVARIMKDGVNYMLGEYSDLTDAVNARAVKEMEFNK